MAKEKGICKCRYELYKLDQDSDVLTKKLDLKKWEDARDTLSLLEERAEKLERCSGMGFLGVRRRIHNIKRGIERHDQMFAMANADAIIRELVWDVGKCPRSK